MAAPTLTTSAIELFHPAVRAWFERRFPEGPTPAQEAAWPHIEAGRHTLVAAPTGSGKTLAGFLVAIDSLYKAAEAGEATAGHTSVVYVSPLKALAVDIHANLETPLEEIAQVARDLGYEPPEITVAVRSGDTAPSERQAMVKRPPSFLVTTPESLYLYLTAERSRETLRSVRTVIVDEIHATARDKRGSHLALTLERLERVCERPPVRIGLSATQKPIETIARLLVGAGTEGPEGAGSVCEVVDTGHLRHVELGLELPDDELEAVSSAEQMADVLDRIATHVAAHRTTLVFVNTRRMAERVAHHLAERLGDERVAAHHGSLSKERRQRVESRLRAGDLSALVATASLELGIDVGPVELVCQIGSPRSIATFLQRVGRSNHSRGGVPRGLLYPLTRDELVECAALLAAVRAGRLDAVLPPVAPLDVLAQQITAEVAAAGDEGIGEEELFALVRRAWPYRDLARADFDEVVELVSEGIPTGRGTRAAYVHRDRVHGVLRPRRGARLAALTSGGAIPETGDYRVVLEPDDTYLGTVNEDWAIESMAGDVFLLGTHSWMVRKVEPGTVRVVDAGGAPPTVPFWLGEAPARTFELSEEVSELRAGADRVLAGGGSAGDVSEWIARRSGLDADAASLVATYLTATRSALGVVPTQHDVVFERFFDETGGTQLVVHAPFGGRINRGLGLALRKKFCVTFDFELQAAANDDGVLLSLGPQHGVSLDEVTRFVTPRNVEPALRQAVLQSPFFTARWRWNLNRALAVLRMKGGRKNPFPIQRMEADDLMAAVFPQLAACQDNAPPGPIEVPDHPLVRQTLHDCLHEAIDLDGLVDVLTRMESGEIRVHVRETTEPSLLAHEILNARPYTFLDDAPLEERRSRSVVVRRGIPLEQRDLSRLDPEAVARVRDEAAPDVRSADELHDLLLSLVVMRPEPEWDAWFAELVAGGRAATVDIGDGPLWSARERRPWVESVWPGAAFDPDLEWAAGGAEADAVAAAVVRGHLDIAGPITVGDLATETALPEPAIEVALAALNAEGFAVRGGFDPELPEGQWCARRLVARIHAYTQKRRRASIKPVTQAEFEEFVARWQHTAPGAQLHGRAGLLEVIEQMQGVEMGVGQWEAEFARRVSHYRPEWLDDLCLSGEVVWGRASLRKGDDPDDPPMRGKATPSRQTPITFMLRDDVPWVLQAVRGEAAPVEPGGGAARDILDALSQRGALFHGELQALTGRLPQEIEEGLWDGVARGLITADAFRSVRSLLGSRSSGSSRASAASRRRARARLGGRGRRGDLRAGFGEGRWSLMPRALAPEPIDELAEAVAEQLLARWGVVFRDVYLRERFSVPWREVVWALRRLEARGQILGGRFVTGVTGEQYCVLGCLLSP